MRHKLASRLTGVHLFWLNVDAWPCPFFQIKTNKKNVLPFATFQVSELISEMSCVSENPKWPAAGAKFKVFLPPWSQCETPTSVWKMAVSPHRGLWSIVSCDLKSCIWKLDTCRKKHFKAAKKQIVPQCFLRSDLQSCWSWHHFRSEHVRLFTGIRRAHVRTQCRGLWVVLRAR